MEEGIGLVEVEAFRTAHMMEPGLEDLEGGSILIGAFKTSKERVFGRTR